MLAREYANGSRSPWLWIIAAIVILLAGGIVTWIVVGSDDGSPGSAHSTKTSEPTAGEPTSPQGPTSATQPTSSAPPTTTSAEPTSPTAEPTTSSEVETSTEPTPDTTPTDQIAVTDADLAAAQHIVAEFSVSDAAASVVLLTGEDAVGTGMLSQHPYAGVILFAPDGVLDGTDHGTPDEVAAVTAALRDDAAQDPSGMAPLIATDQEYGAVQRLRNGFTSFPSAHQFGLIDDLDTATRLAEESARAAAQEMRAVGISVDFAPVFGVLPDDGGPSAIGDADRSYGSDPQRVAALVAAVVTGYQEGGVATSVKHFPGLARLALDSHTDLPSLDVSCENWNEHEAIPAQAGVDAGTTMMMVGHMLLPAVGATDLPASINPIVIEDLLRGDGVDGCTGMNYTGVTVTDSMRMDPITDHYNSAEAAVLALNAGQDLLLMPADPAAAVDGIVAAVASGDLSEDRLYEAAARVMALRIASNRVTTPDLSVVANSAHQDIADEAFAAAQ